ncbi:hypothetical protein NDU88_008871 [Pleurodeles waltl]|uniref:Uncharacterized protein n=1 Tax=Pleurodeles waltl TaxID=8319 RepID=A0AAV7PXW2_PLEWA|nr:hypothetical protein NDU88_008871 [Pleurodeles waltl]
MDYFGGIKETPTREEQINGSLGILQPLEPEIDGGPESGLQNTRPDRGRNQRNREVSRQSQSAQGYPDRWAGWDPDGRGSSKIRLAHPHGGRQQQPAGVGEGPHSLQARCGRVCSCWQAGPGRDGGKAERTWGVLRRVNKNRQLQLGVAAAIRVACWCGEVQAVPSQQCTETEPELKQILAAMKKSLSTIDGKIDSLSFRMGRMIKRLYKQAKRLNMTERGILDMEDDRTTVTTNQS